MNIIETMKQALEALTNPTEGYEDHFSAITNLRAAIDAVEKQEPVAYRAYVDGIWFVSSSYKNLQAELMKAGVVAEIEPLYSK